MFTKENCPHWIDAAKANELLSKHKQLDLCEIDSLLQPGKKFQFFITPPTDTAMSASMRYISNMKDNANDIPKYQETLYSFCFVTGETGLMREREDESLKARIVSSIGSAIGAAYPMPEVGEVKKSFRAQ
ncbi:MAG TPA: hypothetical protein VK154_10150 [Chitinophagales bacterium]|nr:hypothetical protein [Chitinophagales bacterium]